MIYIWLNGYDCDPLDKKFEIMLKKVNVTQFVITVVALVLAIQFNERVISPMVDRMID